VTNENWEIAKGLDSDEVMGIGTPGETEGSGIEE
jgi:hypothetical protein